MAPFSIPTTRPSNTAAHGSTGPWCATTTSRRASSGRTTSARWTSPTASTRRRRPWGVASTASCSTSTSSAARSSSPRRSAAGKASLRIVASPIRVRSGPMLRYADHERAVVWLETVTPAMVRVRCTSASGGKPSMHWASTVRAGGRHFAAVEITGLQQQTYYRYTVDLAPLPAHGEIPVTPEAIAAAFPELSAPVARGDDRAAEAGLARRQRMDRLPHAAPEIRRPPALRDRFVPLVSGRCQRRHGLGPRHAERPRAVARDQPQRQGEVAGLPVLRRRPDLLRRDRRRSRRHARPGTLRGAHSGAGRSGGDGARQAGRRRLGRPFRASLQGLHDAGQDAGRPRQGRPRRARQARSPLPGDQGLLLPLRASERQGNARDPPSADDGVGPGAGRQDQQAEGLRPGTRAAGDRSEAEYPQRLAFAYFLPHWNAALDPGLRRNPMAGRFLAHNFLLWDLPFFEAHLPRIVDSSNLAIVVAKIAATTPRREAGMPPTLPSTPISTSARGRPCARCARCWRTSRRSSCSTITRRPTTGTAGLSWVRMLHNKNDALRAVAQDPDRRPGRLLDLPGLVQQGAVAMALPTICASRRCATRKRPAATPCRTCAGTSMPTASRRSRRVVPRRRSRPGSASTGTTGCPSIRPSWCPTAARENSWSRRTRRFASSTTTIRRAGRCRRPSIPRSSTGCARSW